MNFVQQLEECLRDLAAEARRHHPGVKEASERATLKLRMLKQSYVQAVRHASSDGSEHPTTRLFQSSDLLHPFLLAANYPNATNSLLEISFRAMKLLMEADAIVPTDGLNLVRVWTIQAQVVTSYYQKVYAKDLVLRKEASATGSATTAASSSGWFSWATSSSTATNATTTTTSATLPEKTTTAKNAVSSSSGQTGQGTSSPVAMERLALEILSCLLQLLELLKNYPEHHSNELWTNCTALACLWLYVVPPRSKVQQAAQATTMQVLVVLFNGNDTKFSNKTWEDLLCLAVGYNGKTMGGAFALCKPTSIPEAEFALELMNRVWKDCIVEPRDFMQSLTVSMGLLQAVPKLSVERTLRVYQWSLTLFLSKSTSYPNEFREIALVLLKPIVSATDACRSHHDFEDGFVFATSVEHSADSLALHFPQSSLWKAGFAIEALYIILVASDRLELFKDPKLIATLTEALSHFATIGASCKDHMLQLVDYCDYQATVVNVKPSIFRKAEMVVAAGNGASLDSSVSAINSINGVLGESLWMSFQIILTLANSFVEIDYPIRALEETFAPFLAILQHYLKRFVGAHEMVDLALRGYATLAAVCLPAKELMMQRKALLTSLAKLSLPSWGRRDPSCQLHDHHVRALLCLLKIVHMHYEYITSDWDLVIWTLEELSMLNVASPLLSNDAYQQALAISFVYGRFPAFSTCFSSDGVSKLVEALTDVCEAILRDRDIVVGDSETVIPVKTPVKGGQARPHDDPDKSTSDGRTGTISGKIISMGAKALYGSSYSEENGSDKSATAVGLAERAKLAFSDEYRQSFVDKIGSFSQPVRINSMGVAPFSLFLLFDVVLMNSFRSKDFSETFLASLSRLAAAAPAVRPFIIDILNLLLNTQLSQSNASQKSYVPGIVVFQSPMLSQLLASEPTHTANLPVLSHEEVLSPICEAICKVSDSDIAELLISVLSMVLQGAGHELQGNAWQIVISALSSLSGDPSFSVDRKKSDWITSCSLAFRSLKLIVDDFLHELPSSPDGAIQATLLDCCHSFVVGQHDINTSLTTIGMLWTIADQDANARSVDIVLSKLLLLSADDRAEVRNAAVNTLFSCIVGRGGNFAPVKWKSCFVDIIFGVYGNVLECLNSNEKENGSASLVGKRRYKVSLHHTRDSVTKQWIATQVLVLRGITRVLRSYFTDLLETTGNLNTREDSDSADVSWFEEAWVRILEFAHEASSHEGDRESLDIRSAGVELIGVCCQLASKAGIQAAITPARVSTNMEVVNGALKSVRETTSKPTIEKVCSEATDRVRKVLFLESFATLECFQEEIVTHKANRGTFPDDTDLQILNKFCSSLGKLYECCKDNELLAPSRPWVDIGESVHVWNDIEARFSRTVYATMISSSRRDQTRFLNQAQRCSLDLLQTMASQGSELAFWYLVKTADIALFVRKDHEKEESDHGDDCISSETVSSLNHEAAIAISEQITKMKDEYSVFGLHVVLNAFSDVRNCNEDSGVWRKRYHKLVIPLLQNGLARIAQRTDSVDVTNEIRSIWRMLTYYLTQALTPVAIGKGLSKIPRVSELLLMIRSAMDCIICEFVDDLCCALATGLSWCLQTARQHASFAEHHQRSEIGRKSNKHKDELITLFEVCFESCCTLNPQYPAIHKFAKELFVEVASAGKEAADRAVIVSACSIVCGIMQRMETMHSLVVSLFSILTNLVSSADDNLVKDVCSVIKAVDVGAMLDQAQVKCDQAEQRAEVAEMRAAKLAAEVAKLRSTNDELRREVSMLEAASALL